MFSFEKVVFRRNELVECFVLSELKRTGAEIVKRRVVKDSVMQFDGSTRLPLLVFIAE